MAMEVQLCWEDVIIYFICAQFHFLGPFHAALAVVIGCCLKFLCYAFHQSPQVVEYFVVSQPKKLLLFSNLCSMIGQKAKDLVASRLTAVPACFDRKDSGGDGHANVERLSNELCDATARADFLEKQLNGCKRKNLAMEFDVTDKIHDSYMIDKLLQESVAREFELVASVSALQESLSTACEEYQQTLEAAQDRNQTLEEQVKQLKINLNWEKEKAEALEILAIHEMENTRSFKQESKLKVVGLKETIKELETKLDTQDLQVAKLNETIEELKSALDTQELQVAKLNETIEALENKLDTQELQVAKLNETIEELEDELDEQELEVAKLNETVEELEDELYTLQAAKLNETIEELEDELYTQELQVAKLNENIKELKIQKKEQDAKLRIEIDALELHVAKLNETIGELTMEKVELAAKLSIASGNFEHFRTLSAEYEEAQAMLEEQKNDLSAKLQKADELAEFYQTLLHEYHII